MEDIKSLAQIDAPYNKKISLDQVIYDNGFALIRMRIKEGKRFTDMDLDIDTIETLNGVFSQWLKSQPE